jgi:hypothetical protein
LLHERIDAMPASEHNRELNRLLVDLGRSLLQYVGECWPWTDPAEEDVHETIDRLVSRQKREIGRLGVLLSHRERLVDFGTYPTEYTGLHYLSLDHLLGEVIAGENDLVGELERAVEDYSDDPEAAELLKSFLQVERDTAAELTELAKSRAASPA